MFTLLKAPWCVTENIAVFLEALFFFFLFFFSTFYNLSSLLLCYSFYEIFVAIFLLPGSSLVDCDTNAYSLEELEDEEWVPLVRHTPPRLHFHLSLSASVNLSRHLRGWRWNAASVSALIRRVCVFCSRANADKCLFFFSHCCGNVVALNFPIGRTVTSWVFNDDVGRRSALAR